MTIWAIVPAAGIGRRMRSITPKQYLPLNGKPVIAHSLLKLASIKAISKIVVVLHPDDTHFISLELGMDDRIITTLGGDERFQSVLNGLLCLRELAAEDDWVVVHDAVRPCVRAADIVNLIQELSTHPVGGLLGNPVDDTLKIVNEAAEVEQTVDRSRYWQAQTPQMFRYGILVAALRRVIADALEVTDESAAMEGMGLCPQMVVGHKDNIKITRAADLAMATNILQAQEAT